MNENNTAANAKFIHLSLAKTTLSLDKGHDLEIMKVNLEVLEIVLGHLLCRTPSTSVRFAPNSVQKKNNAI